MKDNVLRPYETLFSLNIQPEDFDKAVLRFSPGPNVDGVKPAHQGFTQRL
jgi:hypothetical protein